MYSIQIPVPPSVMCPECKLRGELPTASSNLVPALKSSLITANVCVLLGLLRQMLCHKTRQHSESA